MTDDGLTPEELGAYHDQSGPLPTAFEWFHAVLVEQDMRHAWILADANLRLALVQHVIWSTQDHESVVLGEFDALAALLAEKVPSHATWPSMAEGLLNSVRPMWEHMDLNQWGPIRPRPLAPDLELVLYFDSAEGEVLEEGATRHYCPLVLSRDADEWWVAGITAEPAVTGWPPDLGSRTVDWP